MATVNTNSKKKLWGGWIVTVLISLFLLLDSVMKIMQTPTVVEQTVKLGYNEASIPWIGVALLISTILYLIPRTAILGAILLTGYLGGAIDCHVHASQPFIFPIIFGILVWVGVSLKDDRLYKIVLMCKRDE